MESLLLDSISRRSKVDKKQNEDSLESGNTKHCKITDLCLEDRLRIVELIDELAKCNEQKNELNGKVSIMTVLMEKQEEQISQLRNSKLEALQEMQNKIESLQSAVQAQILEKQEVENSLKQQINKLENENQQLNFSLDRVVEDNQNLEINLSKLENKLIKYKSFFKKQGLELVKVESKKSDVAVQASLPSSEISTMTCKICDEDFSSEGKQEEKKKNDHSSSLKSLSMDDILLRELFFVPPNLPPEFESLFFLPPVEETFENHEYPPKTEMK